MRQETLIAALICIGDDLLTAKCRAAYVCRVLYQWELQEYLANREGGNSHESSYDDILKNRKVTISTITSGW